MVQFMVRRALLYLSAFTLAAVCAGHDAGALPFSPLESSIKELHRRPSLAALNNLKNYIRKSTSSRMRNGINFMAKQRMRSKVRRLKRADKAIRINGRTADWRRKGIRIYQDTSNDLFAIDSATPVKYSKTDDIQRAAVLTSDGAISFMIEPLAMPAKGRKFYYALNLFTHEAGVLYLLSFTDSGFWLQEYDPAGNKWVRSDLNPGGCISAGRNAVEVKVPFRLLRKLPRHFYVQAVSWDEARNAYDTLFFQSTLSRRSEEYYNYALDLLVQYAERAALPPDNPLPLAQAVVDSYWYRMGNAAVKERIINDGIAMLDEIQKASQYEFPGQEKPLNLPFEHLLVWANRSLYFSMNNPKWKVQKTLNATGGVFTEEMYEHFVLAPAVLDQARAYAAEQDLLKEGDLAGTMRAIETHFSTVWKYRAPLDFIEMLYRFSPEWYGQLYFEVVEDYGTNGTVITRVGSDDVVKWWNQSAPFQLGFVREYGYFFGNCGDAAVLSAAVGKALGIPSIHTHYDVVAPNNGVNAVHSFAAYYSSGQNRYLGYRRGDNRIFEFATAGLSSFQVRYINETPIVTPLWNISSDRFHGQEFYQPSNTCAAIAAPEAWEDMNRNGMDAAAIERCIHGQLFQ